MTQESIIEAQELLLELFMSIEAVVLGAGAWQRHDHERSKKIEPKIRYHLSSLASSKQLGQVLDSTLEGLDFTLRQLAAEKGYEIFTNGDCVSMLDVRVGKHSVQPIASYYDWFTTYQCYTDEKEKEIQALDKFFQDMAVGQAKELFKKEELHVLDVGFGDGQISAGIAQSLASIHPQGGQAIRYEGIEIKQQFVDQASEKLQKTGVKVALRHGNLYQPQSGNIADIVIASHVYPENIRVFCSLLQDYVSNDGMIVMIHEDEGHIAGFKEAVNQEYGKDVLQHTNVGAESIATFLQAAGQKVIEYDYSFKTSLPRIDDKTWDIIQQTPTGVFALDYYQSQGLDDSALDMLQILFFLFFFPPGGMVQSLKDTLYPRFKDFLEERDYVLEGRAVIHCVY